MHPNYCAAVQPLVPADLLHLPARCQTQYDRDPGFFNAHDIIETNIRTWQIILIYAGDTPEYHCHESFRSPPELPVAAPTCVNISARATAVLLDKPIPETPCL